MKILFIGTGLTHYYNQTLNRLNQQPGVEIINLVDSAGQGQVGNSVFQTEEGVSFKIVSLKEITVKKYSAYSYKSFVGLAKLLENLRPDILVFSESYLKNYLYDKKIRKFIKENGVKVIMRDIPFRTDKYAEAKDKILRGELDNSYTPFIIQFILRVSNKLKLNKIFNLGENILKITGLNNLYKKFIIRKVLLKRLEIKKQILNLADAHVNYVEEAVEIFGSYGVPKEKIFITYNSPDTDILFAIRRKIEAESPILPPAQHRILHLSRLIPWKRVDMLIEAVKNLKTDFPDTELLIIGSGPEENNLKEQSKKLGVEESVKFLGGIYDQEVLGKYIMSSNIYVLAGMGGLSINDAMSFGLPVICSVCDGTEKKLVYNGLNGLYFKEGDVLDLTEKIKTLFKNPDLMKKMGEDSTKIIKEKINIQTVITGYLKAFNYVIKK